jgi:hypothetical protein
MKKILGIAEHTKQSKPKVQEKVKTKYFVADK